MLSRAWMFWRWQNCWHMKSWGQIICHLPKSESWSHLWLTLRNNKQLCLIYYEYIFFIHRVLQITKPTFSRLSGVHLRTHQLQNICNCHFPIGDSNSSLAQHILQGAGIPLILPPEIWQKKANTRNPGPFIIMTAAQLLSYWTWSMKWQKFLHVHSCT